jgi:hypothetical protein
MKTYICKMESDPETSIIGIGLNGLPVVWEVPAGMDPAVSWESLLVGAAWNAAGKANAEAAALEHYYTS